MRTLHLFAGAGGGLLADLILGHTPVAAVEWDRYCCQVLRERAAEGWFPDLHVHEGDIRLFDPSEYAGRVDCIAAGFPCTDVSNIGDQGGIREGTSSGLWSEVVRCAGIVRPAYLFLENVAAIVALRPGLDVVLADIAALGFDAQWCCVRASDVGAAHARDRWFLLAHSQRAGLERHAWNGDSYKGLERMGKSEIGSACPRRVLEGGWREVVFAAECDDDTGECPCGVDYCDGCVCPGPTEDGYEYKEQDGLMFGRRKGRRKARSIEPDVGRVAHGVASRVDRLKALGNGQVPIQAALAWRILTA